MWLYMTCPFLMSLYLPLLMMIIRRKYTYNRTDKRQAVLVQYGKKKPKSFSLKIVTNPFSKEERNVGTFRKYD